LEASVALVDAVVAELAEASDADAALEALWELAAAEVAVALSKVAAAVRLENA
jgi:hypothetical protein